ncbi:MAG: choice-of-anchor D domain-containing protein [Deltaproteobacteria bacterium]|nr:choice-of-anchor D domain-containing protein [Deltaproteobacteria bacterium]
MRARGLGLLLLLGCEEGAQIGQLRPSMILDPPPGTPLGFDPVVIGLSAAGPRIIEVSNDGAASLQLGWRVEGPDQVRVSSFPKNLEAGRTGEIWVRFEPVSPTGTEATRLILESNDPEQAEVSYPLELSAREPCRLSAWPEYLRFQVGQEADIGLLAAGSAPCEVRSLRLDEELFALVDPPELPVVIGPGQELPIRVRHLQRTGRPGVPVRELLIRDQDGQEVKVELEGAYPLFNCVSAFPEKILFPDTTLGFVVNRNITVTNRCNEPAAVTSMAVFFGYHAFVVGGTALPAVVPALGAIDVAIQYRPFDDGGDVGSVFINTDDSARPRLETILEGKAIYPGLRTLPSLDLGPVGFTGSVPSSCGSRVGRLPVWSTGRGPLLIDGVTFNGPDATAFEYLGAELDQQPLAGPGEDLIVPVGRKAELLFRFRPLRADPARHSVRVELHHYDFNGPRFVELVGRAADLSPRSESQVVAPEKVDLLVAVDDSRSMQAEQERLVVAAANFVSYADGLGADYQLAATPGENSGSRAGELRGCVRQDPVLRSIDGTTIEKGDRFGCMMRTGRRGDDQQSALGAAALALKRALFPTAQDPSTAINARFLRPDTRLVIFAASDEDDASRETIPALLDYFRAARGGRADRVQVHALAGTPGQTCADDPFLNPGVRYQAMTTLAGGAFYEICQADYGPYLTDLATRAFVPSGVFTLSGSVDPPSLRVELDGTVLSPGPDYRYDPDARTVSLVVAPALGQVMTASYRGECLR